MAANLQLFENFHSLRPSSTAAAPRIAEILITPLVSITIRVILLQKTSAHNPDYTIVSKTDLLKPLFRSSSVAAKARLLTNTVSGYLGSWELG